MKNILLVAGLALFTSNVMASEVQNVLPAGAQEQQEDMNFDEPVNMEELQKSLQEMLQKVFEEEANQMPDADVEEPVEEVPSDNQAQ